MPRKTAAKTVATGADVEAFVEAIADERQRDDSRTLLKMMGRATKATPKMWGSSIVGFGSYHYKYASGQEGDWCITGFSPRKGNLTVYILPGLHLQAERLKKLGKIKTGKSCIYIKSLSDVHLPTLEAMVKQAVVDIRKFTPKVSTE